LVATTKTDQLATEASVEEKAVNGEPVKPVKPKRRSRRRKTAHLKMVPATKELRESLRATCQQIADTLDRAVPPSKDQLEGISRKLLQDAGQPEGFLGWIMVVLSTLSKTRRRLPC